MKPLSQLQHPFAGSSGQAKRKDLAQQVGHRDGFQCFLCGCALYSGRRAHNSAVLEHLEPWRLSPQKTYDPNNLRLCCKLCHDSTCARIEAQHSGNPKAIAQAKLQGSGFTPDGKPIW